MASSGGCASSRHPHPPRAIRQRHSADMDGDDPHDLSRFEMAQANQYQMALSEIRGGHKRSHWMWFIFPQFDGLGSSSTSRWYAIKSVAEAGAFRVSVCVAFAITRV